MVGCLALEEHVADLVGEALIVFLRFQAGAVLLDLAGKELVGDVFLSSLGEVFSLGGSALASSARVLHLLSLDSATLFVALLEHLIVVFGLGLLASWLSVGLGSLFLLLFFRTLLVTIDCVFVVEFVLDFHLFLFVLDNIVDFLFPIVTVAHF